MNPLKEYEKQITRRELLFSSAKCLGGAALGSLVAPNLISAQPKTNAIGGLAGVPHFAPKAKRVIMLFFSGGPSHIDTYDYKPAMRKFHGEELPDSVNDDKLNASIDTLLINHDKEIVVLYLHAFHTMNNAGWKNLEKLLENDGRLQF